MGVVICVDRFQQVRKNDDCVVLSMLSLPGWLLIFGELERGVYMKKLLVLILLFVTPTLASYKLILKNGTCLEVETRPDFSKKIVEIVLPSGKRVCLSKRLVDLDATEKANLPVSNQGPSKNKLKQDTGTNTRKNESGREGAKPLIITDETLKRDSHRNKLSESEKSLRELEKKAIRGKETVSIEQVMLFPEKYVGQRLIFRGCKIGLDIYKPGDGTFRLTVTSRGGKYVFPFSKPAFTISKSMAEKIAPHLKGAYEWFLCDIKCLLLDENKILVLGIDVYNRLHQLRLIFREQFEQKESNQRLCFRLHRQEFFANFE